MKLIEQSAELWQQGWKEESVPHYGHHHPVFRHLQRRAVHRSASSQPHTGFRFLYVSYHQMLSISFIRSYS